MSLNLLNNTIGYDTIIKTFKIYIYFPIIDGSFSPDIARYAALSRKAKQREYRYQQQVYYAQLLKDVLINRQVRIINSVMNYHYFSCLP